MKNYLFLFIFVLVSVTHAAFSTEKGGGVIVGNGAGMVENNFQFAYHSLENILNNCLIISNCGLQDDEQIIVKKIVAIVKLNADKKDRLVFVSEKQNPGFFTTSESETNRIAKTGLRPDVPIYINTDQLYKENGAPALDFEHIIAILVHELGHQSGVLEHTSLDILGTKVGCFAENHTDYYSYKIESEEENGKDNKRITFSVANFDFPVKSSMIFFNWQDKNSVNLSNAFVSSLSCQYDSESYAGVEVTNGHFAFDSNNNLVFQAWAKVLCYESFSGNTFSYRKNLSIMLDDQYKILSLIVE